MKIRYNIQSALQRNYSSDIDNIADSHFWRLIQASTYSNGAKAPQEVEDICEKDFCSISATAAIDHNLLNLDTSIKNPTFTHIVYGDRVPEIDAKGR